MGIIGFNSNYKYWSRYLSESNDLKILYKSCMEYNLALCDNPWYAFLVSVVAGDIEYDYKFIDNGYLAYAALCSTISIVQGTANVPISDQIRIWHEFDENVLRELADSGIVTFRHSPLYKTPVVYDGITAGFGDENLKLYCNVRMIQLAISYINKLFQWYIGRNIHKLIENRIIHRDLTKLLEVLVSKNVITLYKFKIEPIYSIGHVKVYFTLQTNYMVKSIELCSVIDLSIIRE